MAKQTVREMFDDQLWVASDLVSDIATWLEDCHDRFDENGGRLTLDEAQKMVALVSDLTIAASRLGVLR